MHIGITLGITQERESLWINGIKQNALFLSKALQATGNKVTIVDTGKVLKSGDIKNKVMWDIRKFPTEKFGDVANDIDVLIMLGTSFNTESIKVWKSGDPRRRVIKYQCGNNYVIDMERCIFPKNDPREQGVAAYQTEGIDQVWYVPQQGHQNKHYYSVLNRVPLEKVIPVPFIWDPIFLDETCNSFAGLKEKDPTNPRFKGFPLYIPGKAPEELEFCIFEPNQNVVKFNMLPTLILEQWKRDGNKVKMLNLMSSNILITNSYYKSILNTLELAKPYDIDIKVYGRKPVVSTLASHADVVISHQWQNPLNYAYLDTLYLQYPLIHNAEMIKDAGYYYPDFDITEGYNQLKLAIETHDENLEEYNQRSEKVLTRYTVFNEELVTIYEKLLKAARTNSGIDSTLSYEYDWETNTYKK